MQKWYHIFTKNTGLSIYILAFFCILPFYFIFRTSEMLEIAIGILMIVVFFVAYRLSFISKGGLVYICLSIEMAISIVMTLYFGYVYFSLFLAFFIGNIQKKASFITLYVIHLVTTIVAIVFGFITQFDTIYPQLPFILIAVIGVVLMPFNMYNHIKHEKLQEQLKDANKKISQLDVLEERQRIARDLHDTLGQKLSLIGLKSDLAIKLLSKSPDSARAEMSDISQTARTALKEVREMVSDMRGVRLKDEVVHVQQILEAAQMEYIINGSSVMKNNTPLLVENVLSMSLKEAVTNVVKHSEAKVCHVNIKQSPNEIIITVSDNGIGMNDHASPVGHGLRGMRERLEFVNGNLDIQSRNGTTLTIQVPNVIQQTKKEGL
ncbi:sensor histidine kinase [Radiobacillus sp. PE A8.2]|uniref:sensor histidine kinase n=1 Tax=Radiobacillus sp. PE A8.2 TaxID=3380349 RepID=UPI00388F0D56